jgi:hypothetical protein
VAKRRRGGIPHVQKGRPKSWPARAQTGSNIAKEHSRRPGKDAQEVRPSTRGKLVLYGCGDCIDDYEGITGHEQYRPSLRLLYFASLQPGTGTLAALRMAPVQARGMRLHRAPAADTQWLRAVLERASRRFGSRVDLRPDGLLALRLGAS